MCQGTDTDTGGGYMPPRQMLSSPCSLNDSSVYACQALKLTDGCSKFLKLNECLPLGFSVELLKFAAIGNACDSEIIEWNTVYYCLSITNLKDGFNGAIVFTPGAILIVLDLSNNRHMHLQFS